MASFIPGVAEGLFSLLQLKGQHWVVVQRNHLRMER